jgi:Putative MetA-pathway of phenol degradation
MHRLNRLPFLVLCVFGLARSLMAQMPFYTDNPDVTDRGTLHFEFYNEYDDLQSSQFPDLRQNTANFKLNYGLPYNLELDFDIPYLAIYRAPGSPTSSGFGDTDMGIKWNFRKSPRPSSPALGASLYIEFPTGNKHQQLSSGLADYWLNFIAQQPFTDKTRLTANLGFLFAGNTSTGVVGIETTLGQVFTGGLSLQHDFNPRLTLGGEIYGGAADAKGLDRDQLQGLGGGQYTVRNGLSFSFAMLGGKYAASPKIGGQIGVAVDFPAVWRSAAAN